MYLIIFILGIRNIKGTTALVLMVTSHIWLFQVPDKRALKCTYVLILPPPAWTEEVWQPWASQLQVKTDTNQKLSQQGYPNLEKYSQSHEGNKTFIFFSKYCWCHFLLPLNLLNKCIRLYLIFWKPADYQCSTISPIKTNLFKAYFWCALLIYSR